MFASIAVSLFVGFVLGIVFRHYVINETEEVKQHVDAGIEKLRQEIAAKTA